VGTLIARSKVLLEKLIFALLVQFPAFCGIRSFIVNGLYSKPIHALGAWFINIRGFGEEI
jgi:hypothetical protein